VEWKKGLDVGSANFTFVSGGVFFLYHKCEVWIFLWERGGAFSKWIFRAVKFAIVWAWGGEYFHEIVQGGVKKCQRVYQIIMAHYYSHIVSPGDPEA
jgi:hypothetical protein